MNKANAIAKISGVFAKYKALTPTDHALISALNKGKLYELFVLSHLLENVAQRGFSVVFKGTVLKFKGAPGQIHMSDSHCEVYAPNSGTLSFWIFVDIEFETLGHHKGAVTDDSKHHELDIVVVTATPPNPAHNQIALGVECKAVAHVEKGLVREALGVRREMALLQGSTPSMLTAAGGIPAEHVPAEPASEFWFAFVDPAGTNYSQSPATFGVEFKHLQP